MSFPDDNRYESRQKIRIFGRYFQLPKPDGRLTGAWLVARFHSDYLPIAVGNDIEILSLNDENHILHKGRVTGLVCSRDPSWVSFELMPHHGRPSILLIPTSCTVLTRRETFMRLLWTCRRPPTPIPIQDPQPAPEVYEAAQREITRVLSLAPAAPSSLASRVWSGLASVFLVCSSSRRKPAPTTPSV
jgi:hypothetical protein